MEPDPTATPPDASDPPPRLAERLLARALPTREIRESVLGDLEELFRERVADPDVGPRHARRWYWLHALRLSARYATGRLAGRRYGGFGPLGMDGTPALAGTRALLRDLARWGRGLVRSPGFTLPVLAVLVVGMTAATAVFAVVDGVVLRPLDLPEADRLVLLCEDSPRDPGYCMGTPAAAAHLGRTASTLDALGFGRTWPYQLTDEAGTDAVRGGLATAGFFRALGVEPAAGRLFTEEEVGDERDDVALLSHAYWTRRYGADPSVVQRTVRIDGAPVRVVGVLPAGFEAPFDMSAVELWRPPHFDPLDPEVAYWRGFRVVGRLAEDAAPGAADAELAALYAGIPRAPAGAEAAFRFRLETLQREVLGDSRPVLLAFLGGAALLLLVVAANVANLVLARGVRRRRDMAVQIALGAGRGRLVREIVGESLCLSAAAVILALPLAGLGTEALLRLAPASIPRLDEVSVDGRVLATVAATAVVLTVLFALLPALRVTAGGLADTLRSGVRHGLGRASGRLHRALVTAEVALSVVLVASAALLARSFAAYVAWEPGIAVDSVVAVSAFVDPGRHPTRADYMAVIQRAEARIAALPGARSAASASAGPLFGGDDGTEPLVTDAMEPGDPPLTPWWFDVGPGYFGTLGIDVLQGREFTEADRIGASPVAVVNETLARVAWPGEDAVGRTIHLPEREWTLEVVGVVADVPPLEPGRPARPELYWSNRQFGRPAPFLLVRASGDPSALLEAVPAALRASEPGLSLGTPFSLRAAESSALRGPRFQALVVLALGVVALAVAVVGVYAVVGHSVARRRHEVGVRVAMGARSGDVLRTVMAAHLRATGAGLLLGLVGTIAVGRFVGTLVRGVQPDDPTTLAAAVAVLFAASTVAALVPALRATRVDPLEVIGAE